MKLTSSFAAAVLFILFAVSAHAQVLLDDEFNGSAIDGSLWQTLTPDTDSSITESGGYAIFEDRGVLISNASFPTNIVITGRFRIMGADTEEFKVALRTDGSFVGTPGECADGLIVEFRNAAAASSANDEISPTIPRARRSPRGRGR